MVPSASETPTQPRREVLSGLQRRQVLDGLSASIVEKGYSATTIADIARAGRVSKSTVYEHFADKEAAFLALHREIVAQALTMVQAAYEHAADAPTWEQRVRRVVSAYLRAMTSDPVHFTVALVEIMAVSPAARQARREAFEGFAAAVTAMTADAAATSPGAAQLSPALALAAMGGLNELILRASEGGAEAVLALEPVATDLLVRLIRDPHPPTR
jgi:AcrR family transcriptional regulator